MHYVHNIYTTYIFVVLGYLGSILITVIYCAEPEIKYDGPADIDSNSVERSDQNIEPRRRKMSLRASVIGQPGILAGVYVFYLCIWSARHTSR